MFLENTIKFLEKNVQMTEKLKKKDFFKAFSEIHHRKEKIIVIQSGILSFAEHLECEISQIQGLCENVGY